MVCEVPDFLRALAGDDGMAASWARAIASEATFDLLGAYQKSVSATLGEGEE